MRASVPPRCEVGGQAEVNRREGSVMRASPAAGRVRCGCPSPAVLCLLCAAACKSWGRGAGMPRGLRPSAHGLELGVLHLPVNQGAYVQPVLPVSSSDLASADPQGELFSWSWYLWPSSPLYLSALPLAFIFATCDCCKGGLSRSCWWEAALFEM